MALIAWYKLDGNALDSSGNGHHGTASGATWAGGKIGQCGKLTGALSTSIPSASWSVATHSVTLSGWFKFIEADVISRLGQLTYTYNTPTGTLLGYNNYGGFALTWGATHNSGTFSDFRVFGTLRHSNGTYTTATKAVIYGEWAHYAVVFDRNTNVLKLYVDGELLGSTPISSFGQGNYTDRSFYINYGSIYGGNGPGSHMNCFVDDVRIYDHALSPKEVKELAKAKVLHYKFDDFQEPTKNLIDVISYTLYSNNNSVYPIQKESYEGHFRIRRNPDFSTYPSAAFSCYTNVFYDSVAGKQYAHSVYVKPEKDVRLSLATSNYVLCPAGVWTRLERVFTASSTESVRFSGLYSSDSFGPNFNPWIEVRDPQCEEKGHVTPFVPSERPGIVHDCSGYDNHAELALATTPRWVPDAKIGSGAYEFDGATQYFKIPKYSKDDNVTISLWVNTSQSLGSQILIGDYNSIGIGIHSGTIIGTCTFAKPVGILDNNFKNNSWNHISVVSDNGNMRYYCNGVLLQNGNNNNWGWSNDSFAVIGRRSPGSSSTPYYVNGLIDDVRIYATALSDEDILELYQTRGSIDSHGNLYVQDINEPENIGLSANNAIKNKTFAGGLGRYTQAHCQVTLTDRGLRIYRTPNLTQSTDGNVMYGGMRISLLDLLPGGIQEGRRYKVTFDVEGQTYQSNSPISITNNMGWGGGGLTPNPLVIKNDSTLGANFQGHKKCEYIFEVRDSIYKVCTTSYSSFIEGNTYPSYNHLTFHFGYGTTGTGTDIYITNFKVIDITDIPLNSLDDKGTMLYEEFSELGPTNGLIAYYPLNGNANDYSGNNNHGVVTGAVPTAGIHGQAYEFKNNGDKITISPISSTPTITLSAWHKWHTTSSTWRTVFGHTGNFHHLIFASNRAVSLWDGSQRTFGYSSPDNEWHLYTIIIESGVRAELYVDGIYRGQSPTTLNLTTYPVHVIGNWGSGSYPAGSLSDARIYNRALSPEEIKILYDVTKPNAIPMQLSNDGTVYLSGELKEV